MVASVSLFHANHWKFEAAHILLNPANLNGGESVIRNALKGTPLKCYPRQMQKRDHIGTLDAVR